MRLLALAVGVVAAESILPEVEFNHFVVKYGKKYRDENERQARYQVFKNNVVAIEKENAKGGSHTYRINSLTDLAPEEFQKYYLGLKMPASARHNASTNLGKFVPDSSRPILSDIDWVSRGAVTPIKDQGQCGSCWTFGSTGAIEGAWQIASGTLLSLSEQQFVDCSQEGGDGCEGGLPINAIKWAETQNLCSESGYPYKAQDGSCHSCSSPVLPAGSVTGDYSVDATTSALKAALNQQPISVGVDANNWQNAGSGVFDNCGTSLDHAVLAVGYTSSSWKVKNSWGTWWGDQGYIHLAMGNTCGVLNEAVIAQVSGSPGPTPPSPTPPGPTPPGPTPCTTCVWNSDCSGGMECYYPTATASSGCCYSSPPSKVDIVV
jgi:C1A family cysteine protease